MEKISAIITCYNEGELLRRAFTSLEEQTDKDFEILIVNDASQDALTNSICHELEKQKKAHIIWHKERGGLSTARNSGYGAMKGGIAVCLDADDVLPAQAVSIIRQGFRQAPQAGFVFGNYIKHEVEKKTRELVDCSVLCGPGGFLDPQYLTTKWLLLGVTPCRKMTWESVGGYDISLSYTTQDVDFWMRVLLADIRGFYINSIIYEWHRSQLGMDNLRASKNWIYLDMKNIRFHDKFGDAIKKRWELLRQFLAMDDFVLTKEVTKQLIRLHSYSFSTLAITILPLPLVRFVYQMIKLIRRFLSVIKKIQQKILKKI